MNLNQALYALLLVILSAGVALAAEPYPNRPIRLIVPFSPGGGVDLLGRTIAQKLHDRWGQAVIVDNRAGGSGNIGTDMVAKASPDGYTLLMGYVGNLAINPSLFRALPYDPEKDFSALTLVATAPNVLVAHPSLAANSVKELIGLAKGKPGALTYASAGNGTVGHMVAELFKSVTGTQIVHVPYKGNGAAVTDLIGGRVLLMFAAPGAVMTYIDSKRLKPLAVASAKRLPELSATPTFAEAGYPNVEASAWYGVLAPRATPKAIVSALNAEIIKIMQMTEVKDRLATQGYSVVTSSPGEFAALIKSDIVKWREVVKASGAKVD